jgi:hypothetical protein
MQELVHHTGLSNGLYQRLGDRFTPDRLRQAWLSLTVGGGGRLREVAGNHRTQEGELSLDVDGAMLACLARGLSAGILKVRKLWLQGGCCSPQINIWQNFGVVRLKAPEN